MKLILFTIIIYTLFACDRKNNSEVYVINPDIESTQEISLTQLMGKYKIIQLETKNECLINKRAKVIKHKGKFYISSNDEIFIFNNEGLYIDKLSKKGNGPESYLQVEDFNIYDIGDRDEIWISDIQNIKKYDASNFKFQNSISIKGENIKKFERLDNNSIIIRASGEYMFILCNNQGEIIEKYKKKDLANSIYKPNPFIKHNGSVFYQIDDTNTGVSCDNGNFKETDILSLAPQKLVTIKNNQEYYEKYGYLKQSEEINKSFTRIHAIQSCNEKTLVITLHPKKTMITIMNNNSQANTYQILPTAKYLKNDIVPTNSMNFMKTISGCISDDSFVFIIPISELNSFDNIKKEQDNMAVLSSINEEDNMLLLEFY